MAITKKQIDDTNKRLDKCEDSQERKEVLGGLFGLIQKDLCKQARDISAKKPPQTKQTENLKEQ